MKALFWVGLVVLVLGIASFFVPIPRSEKHGIKAGDVSIGVQTNYQQRVPSALGAALIIGGALMMIGGGRRSAA